MPKQENVFHKTGDGAGRSRLQKAEDMRAAFRHLIKRSHPSGNILIEQVREYGGAQICMFVVEQRTYNHHRLAVFKMQDGAWVKDNDIIVSQS